jgi:hypothetical protein
MNVITWDDGMRSRGLTTKLLVVRGDRIERFRGEDLPGLAVKKSERYEKNGKWSRTIYEIVLGPGVEHIVASQDWDDPHMWFGNTGDWSSVYAKFKDAGYTGEMNAFKARMRELFPQTSQIWDEREEKIRALLSDIPASAPPVDETAADAPDGDTVKLVNCTPHPIVVCGDGYQRTVIQPSGQVARIAARQKQITNIAVNGVIVPVFATEYGQVEGLPDPEPNTFYIVARLVLQACPNRKDLLAPGELVRDANGTVIGCKGFSR